VQDIRLVVEKLQAIDEDQYLYSRVVETGLVVTYARAYTLDSERRRLPRGAASAGPGCSSACAVDEGSASLR
jgi:hypothetical protein